MYKMLKMCSKCGVNKFMSLFTKELKSKDGHSSKCKECCHKYNQERYKLKREKLISQSSNWNQKNPDKVKQYKKRFEKRAQRNDNSDSKV